MGKIKGITVELGGDVSGLDKALKTVNRSIGSTQTELKKVDRLLKLDPTNTELLKQKQDLLSQAVGDTTEKLEALKRAKAKADQDMANGTEVSEKQYRKLQQEIASTEQALKGLEKQAAASNSTLSKISSVSGKMADVSGKIGNAMMPITAAVAAGAGTAVVAMDRVDAGLDAVAQKTGATGQAAKELQEVYNRVAQVIPAEFGDIGAAVGEVNTRLGFTGDILEAASAQFLRFAKVNGTDVNTSVQLVTRAMGDAGISADRYGEILDALTVAGQKSGISIDTLTTNLAKYGAPMRALGIDTKTSIAMFAGWEKAGVNTEIAFSGMKKAISNWGAAGKDSTVEFKKALASIKAAPSIAAATTKAIEVFGAKAGPDLADAIRGGRFEVDEYIKALDNAAGAVTDTYGMIVDEVDDTQLAAQTAQLALHDIGETIAKTLGPWLKELAGKLKEVSDRFGSLSKTKQGAILAIAGVAAAIGPLAKGISAVGTAIKVLSSTVIPALNAQLAALAANPVALAIAIIVVAVAALVAGFIYLWNNCEEFRQFWIDLWDNIVDFFMVCWDGIVKFFTKTIPDAWNSVVNFFKGIPEWWQNLWKSVGDFFVGIWNSIVTFFNELPAKIGYALGRITGFFIQLPGKIKAALVAAIDRIKQWGADIWNWVTVELPLIIGEIGNWFAELPGRVWTWLKATVQKVVDWGAELVNKAFEAARQMVDKVVTTVKELPGKMLEIGKNIVRGIWDGISNMWQWLKDKVGDFFGGFVQGVKDQLGIHSPSRVFAGIGEFMAAGLGEGFEGQMQQVAKTMQGYVPGINIGAPGSAQTAALASPAAGPLFAGGLSVNVAAINNYDTNSDLKVITETVMEQISMATQRRMAVGR